MLRATVIAVVAGFGMLAASATAHRAGGCTAAGTWAQNTPGIAATTWTITADGKAQETGGPGSLPPSASGVSASGTGTLAGQELTITFVSWDTVTTGVLKWTLTPDCRSGQGTLTLTGPPSRSDIGKPYPSTVTGSGPPATTTTGESSGANISVQFRGFANHPANIRSPLGRHDGWKISAETSSVSGHSVFVHYTDGDIAHRGVSVGFRIVGKHLVSEVKYGSVLVRVVRLDLELRQFIPAFAKTSTLPKCRKEAKGTITITDDPQVAGQTGPPHTLDKIVIDIPRCHYLDATVTNVNSFANEPFEGGQQAVVTIRR